MRQGRLGANATAHFRLYPVATKAQAPEVCDRYYKEAARDGVEIKPGFVYYSDNEMIFKSKRLFNILDEHQLLHEFSAEYEPWGNGGIESVFRYCVEGMCRAHIRGGAPDELWEFSALDQESLLNSVRSRDGTSVREKWCGRRPDISRRRVLFCKITARKPIPWRTGKIGEKQIEGVYCGKARNKQGAYIWTEKHGLCTSTNYTCFETEFPLKDGTMTFHSPARGGGGGGAPVASYDDDESSGGDDSGDESDTVTFDPKDHGPRGPKPASSDDESESESTAESDQYSESGEVNATKKVKTVKWAMKVKGSTKKQPKKDGSADKIGINTKWCAQIAKHMILTGVVPSTHTNAKVCSSMPSGGSEEPDYVPGARMITSLTAHVRHVLRGVLSLPPDRW